MSTSDGAAEGAILAAIVTAPRAWVRINALGDGDVVLRLVLAGILDVWPLEDGDAVTLTPWAAASLNVELGEFGSLETPRWVEVGTYVPLPRVERFPRETDMPHPELVPDPLLPEVLLDEDGEPVILWNEPIRIDSRIPPASKGLRKPRPKRRRSA